MTIAASKPKSPESRTPDIVNALGEWIAPIIVWFAVGAMLLAVVALLLGPAQ